VAVSQLPLLKVDAGDESALAALRPEQVGGRALSRRVA
jgi:hypothetical protein